MTIPRSIKTALRHSQERAENERDAWIETARQHARNEDFYRGVVRQIGELFGDAAKTSDDGSVQQDVLALKVPELVVGLKATNAELLAALGLIAEFGDKTLIAPSLGRDCDEAHQLGANKAFSQAADIARAAIAKVEGR